MFHILDITDRRLLRGVESNHHRPDNTRETAHLADETEPLFQKNRRENSGDHDRERPQRRDQNRIHKRIRNEIADLPDNHEDHPGPPPEVLEVSVPFARFFIVFDVRLEETRLLQHERGPDEDTRRDGQRNADGFVCGRTLAGGTRTAGPDGEGRGMGHERVGNFHGIVQGIALPAVYR